MTKIKICGLTRVEEAEYLNRNHVDFAGFVLFFPKSRRNNAIEQAKRIMEELSKNIKTVAVTVQPTLEQIRQIEEAGFDYIQIHGKLTIELLNQISIPVLKAFNVNDMEEYQLFAANEHVVGYVFDANEPGSGKVFDWNLIQSIPRDHKLFLLAGGLNCDNVKEAVRMIKPDGVDVSSGVEYEDRPGKDPDKIDEFCRIINE